MPYKVEKEEQEGRKRVGEGRVGVLDPGVRTFMTNYSEKECGMMHVLIEWVSAPQRLFVSICLKSGARVNACLTKRCAKKGKITNG